MYILVGVITINNYKYIQGKFYANDISTISYRFVYFTKYYSKTDNERIVVMIVCKHRCVAYDSLQLA